MTLTHITDRQRRLRATLSSFTTVQPLNQTELDAKRYRKIIGAIFIGGGMINLTGCKEPKDIDALIDGMDDVVGDIR